MSDFWPDQVILLEISERILISAILLALLIILSFWQRIRMETLFFVSFFRGLIQIVLMASFLIIVFALETLWILYSILLLMCVVAALTANQRLGRSGMLKLELLAITIASLSIMSLVVAIGIIPPEGAYIIPMGGMVISNVMVITLIVLERLVSDIQKAKGRIEAALALGDTPKNAIKGILKNSYRAGLLPSTNRVAVLGIVTIPGLMSGMIIGGANPIVAAVYQVIAFLMILSAGFIGSIIASNLCLNHLFTEEDQLNLDMVIPR
jgi:putative ABC transport system permease protein